MKVLILGAGPAGLTLGNRLKEKGIDSFQIIEKENCAGGLCRSVMVDGYPFDIGGPHFVDDRNPQIVDYLFSFMPKSEFTKFDRSGQVLLPDGQLVGSPIESYIWELNRNDQADYLESISRAGCNRDVPMPEKFIDWIYWKLGDKIADNYMLPYNSKLFGENLNELGTYWLYKLPNVSFRDTLMSCLEHQFYGVRPGASQYYFSLEHGSGELWNRMANRIGEHISYNKEIDYLNMDSHIVRTKDGEEYQADIIISSIPWAEFSHIDGMPKELFDKISKLKSISLELRYVEEELESPAHFVYCSDKKLPFHRANIRKNLFPGSHGMALETRKERVELYKDSYQAKYTYMNKYAYPVNTIGKPEIMDELIKYAKDKRVYGVGRWGEHKHHNSDVVVELMLKFADEMWPV